MNSGREGIRLGLHSNGGEGRAGRAVTKCTSVRHDSEVMLSRMWRQRWQWGRGLFRKRKQSTQRDTVVERCQARGRCYRSEEPTTRDTSAESANSEAQLRGNDSNDLFLRGIV